MKVVVRVRPENMKEKAAGFHKVVHVVDKHILVFDPKQEEISFFHGKKTINRDITKRQNKDIKFVFDAVFNETSTQLEVFEHTTKPIIRSFLNGYNCTVLAYGATGAGKTHTMLGSAAEPGVMYLTMLDLYKSMDEIKEEKVCSTAVSYLEVYNEQIRDLLVNSGPLAVWARRSAGLQRLQRLGRPRLRRGWAGGRSRGARGARRDRLDSEPGRAGSRVCSGRRGRGAGGRAVARACGARLGRPGGARGSCGRGPPPRARRRRRCCCS